jgi:hypothetical protein
VASPAPEHSPPPVGVGLEAIDPPHEDVHPTLPPHVALTRPAGHPHRLAVFPPPSLTIKDL